MEAVMRQYVIWILLASSAALSGCSTMDIHRTVYDFMYNKSCFEQTGYHDCDPNRMTYDEYQRERMALLADR
jgi:hypothetical protein